MKSLAVVFLGFLVSLSAYSSTTEKYSEVRIFATEPAHFRDIQKSGLFIDHANTKPGQYLDAWLSETEIELLRKSGVPFEILIDNWDVYYKSLPKMSPSELNESIRHSAALHNVTHSIYGSMGGYLTYNEVVGKLDSMRLEYPHLISQKFSIGLTHEGRNIWAVRVTKNPDAPTGRPEVMYHALIHAREPESMETQVYYFYWLFENYGIDPIATYILENREIYWIPVFNPDGYVYNQTTNPNGGGLWRKNRKPCSGGTGTDLNRNYGIYEFWNSSNGGSSTSCGSDTYRGTTPFSEPETRAIRDFVNSRNFNTSFGAHTHGNLLIKPWAWCDPTPTPDDFKFNQFLADMRASNPIYISGTPSQTVGYFVRGGSDDWYYHDSSHTPHHIFAITPETGTSFWPPQNQIVPLAQGMLLNNQYMSLIAGAYVSPLSRTLSQQTYLPGQSGTLKVVFRNKGVMDAGNVQVSLTSGSGHISIPTTQFTYPSMASFATDSCTFDFTISSFVADNSAIPTLLTIKIDTSTVFSAQVFVLIGAGSVVLNDNGSSFGNWTTNGTWGVTTAQFFSPPSSFTDSPGGSYGNNVDNSMTLASVVRADSFPVLSLGFRHRYATEASYDFCNIEVSSDNGASWQSVTSYSGTLSTWTQQTFDISRFANSSPQTKIRFRLTSDISVTGDGWYVDDIQLRGYPLSVDTGVVIQPGGFTFTGPTGTEFTRTLTITNHTLEALQVTVAESSVVSTSKPAAFSGVGSTKLHHALDMSSILGLLQSAFQRAGISLDPMKEHRAAAAGSSDNPEFSEIIVDERGENVLGGADIYRVDHQVRTVPLVGTFHDFRIVMSSMPDSNVAGFISIDTDQDFATGNFPPPFGVGSSARDIGSEREIFFDASGIIIDSLLGTGRIPAGVVLSASAESLTVIGLPFPLTITRDSVFTISTNTLLTGIREEWLADPDRKMNVGVTASRIASGANPLPDLAPGVGHGTVGAETGVSWVSENPTSFSVPPGNSVAVTVRTLAAKHPGTYNALLVVMPQGREATMIPISMTVTTPASPHIGVFPTLFIDTLAVNDSISHPVQVSNTGGSQLTFGIIDSAGSPWFVVDPRFGLLDSGNIASVNVLVRSAGLTPGTTYPGRFYILSNDPGTPAVQVSLSLHVRQSTSVEDAGTLPTSFSLHQNYPNPFNPTTEIRYDIPVAGHVTIRIYDVLGREIRTLVDETKSPGRFNIKLDASPLASGVYFYRMTAGNFSDIRKMIVLR